MTRRRSDLFAAGAFGALALVFLWQGRNLRFTSDEGVPGAGFFPVLMAAATLVMAVSLAAQALRRTSRQREGGEVEPRPDSTVLADQTGLEALHAVHADTPVLENEEPASQLRTILVFALIVSSAVLLPLLGFIAAMLVLSCGIMFAVERRFDPVSIACAVLLPLLTYGLFGLLLDVRLPSGPFG